MLLVTAYINLYNTICPNKSSPDMCSCADLMTMKLSERPRYLINRAGDSVLSITDGLH